jgi:hypothetical protein
LAVAPELQVVVARIGTVDAAMAMKMTSASSSAKGAH